MTPRQLVEKVRAAQVFPPGHANTGGMRGPAQSGHCLTGGLHGTECPIRPETGGKTMGKADGDCTKATGTAGVLCGVEAAVPPDFCGPPDFLTWSLPPF